MIINQGILFLIFVLNGIIIGLIFDFFRILRKSFKTSNFITYIEDILFWVLTGLLLIYSIFKFNNGEIRLFMLFGVFMGCVIYMLLISSFFIRINVKIISILKKITKNIIIIINIPISLIKKISKKVFFKPIHFITINYKKAYRKIENIKKIKNMIKKPNLKNNKLHNNYNKN